MFTASCSFRNSLSCGPFAPRIFRSCREIPYLPEHDAPPAICWLCGTDIQLLVISSETQAGRGDERCGGVIPAGKSHYRKLSQVAIGGIMGRGSMLTALLVAVIATSMATGQEKSSKDIFIHQDKCPLKASFPITGSAFVAKNVSQKVITEYKLGCFQQSKKKYRVVYTFEETERGSVLPGETTGNYGFDATPPNFCRKSNAMIGIYWVKFGDGSSWTTSASQ